MSFNKNSELRRVALELCRELRRRQTPAEKIIWERVRNKKLNGRKFYRQHPLFFDHLGKETFYIADFYCYQTKLVVELDGPIHLKRKKEDQLREKIINSLGIRVIRFKNETVVNETEKVMTEIKKYL